MSGEKLVKRFRDLRRIKAWCNMDGTGTIAIRESDNMDPPIDNGGGDYTFNLTKEMPDKNFAPLALWGNDTGQAFPILYPIAAKTVSSFRLRFKQDSGGYVDGEDINVAVVR